MSARDQNAQGRFGELLDAAPDAIIESDAAGHIVLVNEIALRMFGYSREEMLALRIEALVPEAVRDRHTSHRESFLAHPSTRPMGTGLELQAARKDGSIFPVEISLSPIQSEAGIHVIAIVRDVTTRRQSEDRFREMREQFTRELEEKNRQLQQRNAEVERSDRLKSEFLASMSHELRSPLHTISGFAELLIEELEGPLNEKQKRFVSNIQHDSQHLLALINDLLDISKIEAGRMEFYPELFALLPAVEEVVEMIRPRAAAKNIQTSIEMDPSIMVHADRVRLRQILTNLLSNAVKFTPEAGRVSVSAFARPGRIAISVADSGVGIAREDHDAIFDKFYQVGSTTKGVREGTGLGLAITKRLVEQQGGKIWVCSELDRGSQFTFTAQASESAGSEPRPLVLIIEDQPRAAELLVNYLTPEGFRTLCVESAEHAAAIAIELSPDAVIVDVSSLAARMIRSLRNAPALESVPIVVVSVAEEAGAASELGVYAHLTKPVGKKKLLDVLSKAVASRTHRPKVLVVDDEPTARELIAAVLHEAGYAPLLAADGAEAIAALQQSPAAAVLDLSLRGSSGLDLLESLRALPVIVLTGVELNRSASESLEGAAVAVLRKGERWKQPLLSALRKSVPR